MARWWRKARRPNFSRTRRATIRARCSPPLSTSKRRVKASSRSNLSVIPSERSETRDPYAAAYREGTVYGSPPSRGRRTLEPFHARDFTTRIADARNGLGNRLNRDRHVEGVGVD